MPWTQVSALILNYSKGMVLQLRETAKQKRSVDTHKAEKESGTECRGDA